MARSKSDPGPAAGMTYEQAMSRLDEIVRAMEDSSLPLEEMVDRYEEGGKLAAVCQARLDEAQARIELINRRADGSLALEPVPAAAPTAPPRQSTKVSPPPTTKSTDEIRLF